MPTTTTTTTTTTTSTSVNQPSIYKQRHAHHHGHGPGHGTAAADDDMSPQATHRSEHTDGTILTAHDHPLPKDDGYGYGEDAEQHAHHAGFEDVTHWGLPERYEEILFYCLWIPSICLEIAAGIIGSYLDTSSIKFIPTFSVFQFLSWAAWFQTAVQMTQRASWVRDEGNLVDRRRFLHLAVRLNRMMVPTAAISLCVFIVAYVRRHHKHDLVNWLLFLLVFIANTVCSVMNAYNNITWESDRLEYEEGSSPYGNTLLAILGIPTKPKKDVEDME